MLGREYFERVLPEQHCLIGQRARLVVRLHSGQQYEVASLLAAHEEFVVFQVYGEDGDEPEHTDTWRAANPDQHPMILDQLAVPYREIENVLLTARMPEESGSRAIGFRLAEQPRLADGNGRPAGTQSLPG